MMSNGRKRVAWRRIANKSDSVKDRLDLRSWRQGKKYKLNSREALTRKLVIGLCLTFFVMVMCSAVNRGIAYQSPILNWTGMIVSIPLTLVGIILGVVQWLITHKSGILKWAAGMRFIGQPGLFRIYLGALTFTIGLYKFGIWVGRKCSHSDESTKIFIKMLAILFLLLVLGIIGVFFRRCRKALFHMPVSFTEIREADRNNGLARKLTDRKILMAKRKNIWPKEYKKYREDAEAGRSGGDHFLCEKWWNEYEQVRVVKGKILRAQE